MYIYYIATSYSYIIQLYALRFLAGFHAAIVKLLNKVIILTFPILSHNHRLTAHDRYIFGLVFSTMYRLYHFYFFPFLLNRK